LAGRGQRLTVVECEVAVSRRGWVLFAIMCVVWGIPYLLIKVAVGSVSVPIVVFARTALGALVLLPLARGSGSSARCGGSGGHWSRSPRWK
jgi:hypothetical protein